jgi:hypothetical protein
MAVVSRLQLDHPALGTTGGAGLHASIQALYQKIGDNMADRLFFVQNLNDAATTTLEHNFKVAFGDMRVDLYLWDEGTGELTRLTSTSSPTRSAFTVAATSGFATTKIDVTNSSGAQRDLAVVILNDPIEIDELVDVDLTVAPQDGQALVYDSGSSKFKAGASGDASFKLQSIAANVLTLKGGHLQLDDGRELATYSSPTYGVDITVSLLTLLASPVDGTAYYLYIDLDSLGSEQTQGLTGRKLYQITQANMILSSTSPAAINRARYVVLGSVMGESGSTYETGNFTTIAARKADNGPVAVNPKVYSLSQAVGSVGSASQIKAGHVLGNASFPAGIATSKYSFFNLSANALDGNTANAKDLTNNGSTAFTGSNIFGGSNLAANLDGTDDNFSSTNAFFNPGNGKSWAAGGWFKATDWTPVSPALLFAQEATASDRGFKLENSTNGDLLWQATNSASAIDATVTIPNPAFTNGTWHHLAMVYDFSTLLLKAYIDGKLVGTATLANQRAVTSATFRIGAQRAGSEFFAGAIEDCFFVNDYLLTDADIRKLYASKLTHNANVSAANQDWRFVLGSGVQKLPSWQPVVDQSDANTLYADFSDLGSTETVDAALLDLGMSPVVVPAVAPFDQTYTSNPSFPISHGLSEVPSLQVGYKDASNDWHWATGEGAVKADSTQIKGSLQTFFDASATAVRLRAVVGASPTGVKDHVPAVSAGLVAKEGVLGRTNGVAVPAGYVGEIISSHGTSSNITSAQYNDRGSITLTAGVWDITGAGGIATVASTTVFEVRVGISSTSGNSATGLVLWENLLVNYYPGSVPVGTLGIAAPTWRVSISSPTTYYLKVMGVFGVSTASADGHIRATRIA